MREQRIIDLGDHQAEEPPEIPLSVIDQLRQNFARQIELMVRLVRARYLFARGIAKMDWHNYPLNSHHAAWDGGLDRYGQTREPVWFRVVQHLVEIGADPKDYIEVQVGSNGRSRNPTPLEMLDPEATERYLRDRPDRVADLRRSLERETSSVVREAITWTRPLPVPGYTPWDDRRALRYALANVVTVNATSLLRYCIGAAMSLTDVCEVYHDEALSQYAFERVNYDAAWGQRIPDDFRQAGAALVGAILGTRME